MIKSADGAVVQANSAPVWQAPDKGGPTTSPVDEKQYDVAIDGGSYVPH